MTAAPNALLNKVPQVTIAFWIIKICATTLGETGGDQLSMTMKLGYLTSTVIFFALFLLAVGGQVAAKRYHPWLYWAAILTTTMVGTTLSDFLDRTAGLGYVGGSLVLIAILASVLLAWRLTLGTIAFDHVVDPKVEAFYWVTILFSNTLGTALGDFTADDAGLGFGGGSLLFGSLIALIAAAYFFTRLPRALLFWAAFVLTRPLGATLGDALTKPQDDGGLALGTLPASALLAATVIILVTVSAWKPAQAPQ